MHAIVAVLACLTPAIPTVVRRQLAVIVVAMLTMTGRITMAGMARWSGRGGSYRTIQRFFQTPIVWATLMWLVFRTHLHRPTTTYLLAGDETVVTKAGTATHGVDRFFSSIYGAPVPGLAFFALSLVSVDERRAFPMAIEQVIRTPAAKAATKAKAAARSQLPTAERRHPGRPKGSRTRPKTDRPLSPELQRIGTMIGALTQRIAPLVPLTYLLLDGYFGHAAALQMARAQNLHLISKLRTDAALYTPYSGPYAGRGPRQIYGAKLDYGALPLAAHQTTTVAGTITTRIFQTHLLHKEFPQPLNVVIIQKTNAQTGKQAHVILFSSDLGLTAATIIDYYGLRFQIEFNFRDAKQHWGLEDFMNVTPTAVTNAANLALFMVNVAAALVTDQRVADPPISILDLKAGYRGQKYMDVVLKLLPEKPDLVLFTELMRTVTSLGRIHPRQPATSPP
jgi:putative transposase